MGKICADNRKKSVEKSRRKILFNEKSAPRIRKQCAMAVVRRNQKFSPRHRPPFRGPGTAKI